jgi:protein SCO1/2
MLNIQLLANRAWPACVAGAVWAGSVLLSSGLAQTTMPAHDMSAMESHEHHHDMDMNAALKERMVEVKPASIPMVRDDGLSTTLDKEIAGNTPIVLAFIYTSCTTICPVTSQVLSNVQDLLQPDLGNVRIISVSIDPEYDTPARLHAYGERFGAKAQWRHYGGTLANSVAIQKLFNAYRGDKMNHVPLIFINGGGKKAWLQIEGFPTAQVLVKKIHGQMHGS